MKPLEISPAAARQVMDYSQDYRAEPAGHRRDGIAAAARHVLLEHMPKGAKLRLSEVKELLERMK